MNQSKFAKTIARGAVLSWREQPTQYELEALRANVERVGLVIKVRWAIVAMLAVFSVVAASVYATSTDAAIFLHNMTVPALALIFVLVYNGVYSITYRRVGNIAFLNHAQLLFDMIVVAVLVYYSGGVYSWFATMYMIFILEAAFILPRRSDVWLIIAAASLLYGTVLFGEYLGWFSHVNMPFVENELFGNFTYMLVRYMWNVTMYIGAGLVGLLMMKSIREREAELRESSFVDELTGLFNRQYFHRVVSSEIERAKRNDGKVALLIADVDQLGEINRTFGVDVGDRMLAAIARYWREVGEADAGGPEHNVTTPCRVGGEELALIVPEVARSEGDQTPIEERALAMAESFRRAVEGVRIAGVGVTASIGIAISPADGESPDALLDAADHMLSLAAAAGGNAVRASWLADEAEAAAEADA